MGFNKGVLRTVTALALALGTGGSGVAAVALGGCSGNASTSSSGDGGGGADGPEDATQDVGYEASGNDGAGNGDVVTGDDGPAGDDAGCSGMARADCVKCCRMGDMSGYQTLVHSELGCACAPAICGPIDGGSDAEPPFDAASDASVLGLGACTASCGSMPMAPDQECGRCVTESLGGMANPGPCFSEVRDACAGDPSCVAYDKCMKTCM